MHATVVIQLLFNFTEPKLFFCSSSRPLSTLCVSPSLLCGSVPSLLGSIRRGLLPEAEGQSSQRGAGPCPQRHDHIVDASAPLLLLSFSPPSCSVLLLPFPSPSSALCFTVSLPAIGLHSSMPFCFLILKDALGPLENFKNEDEVIFDTRWRISSPSIMNECWLGPVKSPRKNTHVYLTIYGKKLHPTHFLHRFILFSLSASENNVLR